MSSADKRAAHPVKGAATVAGTGLAVAVCCAALPLATALVGGLTVVAILGLSSLALVLAATLGALLVGRSRRQRACARSGRPSREGKP